MTRKHGSSTRERSCASSDQLGTFPFAICRFHAVPPNVSARIRAAGVCTLELPGRVLAQQVSSCSQEMPCPSHQTTSDCCAESFLSSCIPQDLLFKYIHLLSLRRSPNPAPASSSHLLLAGLMRKELLHPAVTGNGGKEWNPLSVTSEKSQEM